MLHPVDDRGDPINGVGAATAAAVQHAGQHEQAEEVARVRIARLDLLVELCRAERRETRVRPAVPHDHFVIVRLERVEFRIVRVEIAGGQLGVLPEVRELVLRVIPRRIVEHEILEQLGTEADPEARRRLSRQRRAGDPRGPSLQLPFAAVRLAGEQDAVPRARLRVDLLQRDPLRVGEAGHLVDRQGAAPRILHRPVFHAVERIARSHDLRVDRFEHIGRDERRRGAGGKRRLRVLDELRADARPVHRRRACHDPVEIVGIAQRFHHRLTAAARTAAEIAAGGRGSVVAKDDGFRDVGRAVHGEVAEVDAALDVVERPPGVDGAALMAGIGARRRVAEIDRRLRRVLHRADESAAAAHEELPVPLVGQQQRELDLGADDAAHLAVRHPNRAGRCPLGGGDRRRFGHLDVGKFQHHEMRAFGVVRWGGPFGPADRAALKGPRHQDNGQCDQEGFLHGAMIDETSSARRSRGSGISPARYAA